MCVTPLPPILFTASVLALALCETLERNVFVMRFIYVTVLFVCLSVCSSGQKNKTKQKTPCAAHELLFPDDLGLFSTKRLQLGIDFICPQTRDVEFTVSEKQSKPERVHVEECGSEET